MNDVMILPNDSKRWSRSRPSDCVGHPGLVIELKKRKRCDNAKRDLLDSVSVSVIR